MSDSNAFQFGDYVILFDRRERQYMFVLEKDGSFESHIGNIDHGELCGQKEGTWFRTKTGHWMAAFRPTKAEYMLNMKRIATVVYPKDIGAVLTYGNLFPGAEILEAGSGSGALTIALSDAVGPEGHVYSYDIRQDMSDMAKTNLNGIAKNPSNVQFFTEDIAQNIYQSELDSAILDMPEPWHTIQKVYECLKPGGLILTFLPTIMQVANLAQTLKTVGEFTLINTVELMERPWEVGGRSVRPSHRMVGHTGFITTARKCQSR
jgi:tRNA (adenine57-N1/adenine58-N1)-methyltransferase